ncbi:DNA-binding winged helix-turn-helix (wHTH) protein [Sphingomonas naasensis]|uniref:Helix-turn-helix domain-containing protein n=1 Tax=Sphingomonas naasensis TaxID=1344951 RepID=A0A4V3QW76_9SPHN|nr:helix-turn-helix domain-containing protein [Sphingomonas naasensis]NIJ21586.1 DNA-binding winged helix-turn-helix (wHTH) protein [Sphingomonas naasensis]TGX41472.1 helix-turn-helix domain-containing protein [Sphingomonas naasensis]
MPIGNDSLAKLLRDAEARLLESRRSVDDALELVRHASGLAQGEGEDQAPALQAVLDSHRDELVGLVLSALEKGGRPRDGRNDYLNSLVYREEDNQYRVGRRQVGLTESEKHVLDLLWQAMPQPVSRSNIHRALYTGSEQATIGTIDVFVSNLRQKLKLASGGRDFIQSIRGQGWALKPELCRHRSRGDEQLNAEAGRHRA